MLNRFLNALGKFDASQIGQCSTSVKWDDETNKWIISPSAKIDPLSSILLIEQPRPWANKNDDMAISTLSKTLGKKVSWIESFQDAWMGLDNRHTSITGFLFGAELNRTILS